MLLTYPPAFFGAKPFPKEKQIITHAVSELINAEHLLKLSILRHREMNEEAESDDGEGPGM